MLCKRAPEWRAPATRSSFSFAFAVIIFLVLVGSVVALYFVVGRSDERRPAEPVVSRQRPGAPTGTKVLEVRHGRSKGLRRVNASRRRSLPRVVLRVKPRTKPAAESPETPETSETPETPDETPDERDEREALAARKRMNRMYEQAALQNAISQVSITMYMADW